jgi:hypothetical protein
MAAKLRTLSEELRRRVERRQTGVGRPDDRF